MPMNFNASNSKFMGSILFVNVFEKAKPVLVFFFVYFPFPCIFRGDDAESCGYWVEREIGGGE